MRRAERDEQEKKKHERHPNWLRLDRQRRRKRLRSARPGSQKPDGSHSRVPSIQTFLRIQGKRDTEVRCRRADADQPEPRRYTDVHKPKVDTGATKGDPRRRCRSGATKVSGRRPAGRRTQPQDRSWRERKRKVERMSCSNEVAHILADESADPRRQQARGARSPHTAMNKRISSTSRASSSSCEFSDAPIRPAACIRLALQGTLRGDKRNRSLVNIGIADVCSVLRRGEPWMWRRGMWRMAAAGKGSSREGTNLLLQSLRVTRSRAASSSIDGNPSAPTKSGPCEAARGKSRSTARAAHVLPRRAGNAVREPRRSRATPALLRLAAGLAYRHRSRRRHPDAATALSSARSAAGTTQP